MTLHLIKLSVGSESVETLADWQAERLRQHGELWHATRMMPKRGEEVIAGGSIYWVIRGLIQARQRVIGFDRRVDAEGRPFTRILIDPELVRTEPRQQRAFQGWRYLEAKAAPPDLGTANGEGGEELPYAMLAELKELGIL